MGGIQAKEGSSGHMSYYHAVKSWYEENKHKLSPLRRKVFRIWLRIMRRSNEDELQTRL